MENEVKLDVKAEVEQPDETVEVKEDENSIPYYRFKEINESLRDARGEITKLKNRNRKGKPNLKSRESIKPYLMKRRLNLKRLLRKPMLGMITRIPEGNRCCLNFLKMIGKSMVR